MTIFTQLDKIHARGVVHADIRDVNIVFDNDGKMAWLIDFDLTG